MSLSDPAIVTAIIAAIVSLIVTLIGNSISILRDYLAQENARRQEIETYYNEVYKVLFSPIISDVFLFIDSATTIMEGPSEEYMIEIKDRVIAHVKEHLSYASPKLIASYHGINANLALSARGDNPSLAEILFLYDLVQEFVRVIKKASLYSDSQVKEIPTVTAKTILYLLHAHELTYIAKYNWMFDEFAYTEKNHKKIAKLIKDYETSRHMTDRNFMKITERLYRPANNLPQTKTAAELEAARLILLSQKDEIIDQGKQDLNRTILKILIKDKQIRETLSEDIKLLSSAPLT